MNKELFEQLLVAQKDLMARCLKVNKGQKTQLEYISYVQDELQEARQALEPRFWKDRGPAAREEFIKELADVYIMLVGLCYVSGLGYDELIQAIGAKVEYNKTRKDRKHGPQ